MQRREARLLRLVGKSRELFVFPREHRHEIFDDTFQSELKTMYCDTGQGEEPQPPVLMCMAVLPRATFRCRMRRRYGSRRPNQCWQMVLATLGD